MRIQARDQAPAQIIMQKPDAEFQLLAACAMWPHSERRLKALHQASAAPLDWGRFVGLVSRHRVYGLVNDGLTHLSGIVPQFVVQAIEALAADAKARNLLAVTVTAKLARLFAQADLPVTFFKGIPLMLTTYGGLGLRQSQDIDILVSKEVMPAAMTTLEDAGLLALDPSVRLTEVEMRAWMRMRKHVSYYDPKTKLVVELHWRLFNNPHLMPGLEASTERRVVPLNGVLGLSTFTPHDGFAYLCAHGSVHSWFRLKWLADIGAIIEKASPEERDRLFLSAEARGVRPLAKQAILLCHLLLQTPLPDALGVPEGKVGWRERLAFRAVTTEKIGQPTIAQVFLLPNPKYWLIELRELADYAAVVLKCRGLVHAASGFVIWLWRQIIKRR